VFIDLRAAFDSVNRNILIEMMKTMREREIRERLVIRMEDNKGNKEQGEAREIGGKKVLDGKRS
jgi:hypothetical protein